MNRACRSNPTERAPLPQTPRALAGGGAVAPDAASDPLRKCQRCGKQRDASEFPMSPVTKQPIATCRACMPQYQRGGKPEREGKRRWQRANREKRAAHKAVEYAVLRGDLKRQPCVRCGSEDRVVAHHDDYSRPLDVMWLCWPCHVERHREIGRPFGPSKKAAA